MRKHLDENIGISDEELADYKALMPQYLNEDIQRGDWTVVHFILSFSAGHTVNILPALAYPMGFQMDSLKWGQLLSLGKTQLRIPYDVRMGSKAKYDEYTAWAVDTFNKYFKPMDPDHPSPPLCPDLAEID